MKKKLIMLFMMISVFSFSENVIRKISVTGNSEREIMPDVANVTFQINVKNKNLSSATRETNEKIEKFKSSLKSKRIDTTDLETISFYSRKQKEYMSEEEIYDSKTVKKELDPSHNKKPTSYTGVLLILIKDTDFEQISGLIEFSDGENIQSIQKNFDDGTFAFNIRETESSPEGTLNKIFSKFSTVKSKLQSLGIASSNIILGEYTFTENFNNKNTEQVDMFYVVHDFKIKLNNIKDLNSVISIADDNGINLNGNIQFDVSDKEKIASEMYSEAFNQAKSKAESILKSSTLNLSHPLVVSEDVDFQQKMIDRIDNSWSVQAADSRIAYAEDNFASELSLETASAAAMTRFVKKSEASVRVDYTPKPIKISQNISVLYEMK